MKIFNENTPLMAGYCLRGRRGHAAGLSCGFFDSRRSVIYSSRNGQFTIPSNKVFVFDGGTRFAPGAKTR